ncbi:hypothetical protein BT93_L0094 [Corymbia citriodora subsp. variegata]|uniref:Transcription factor CBF/NF-Y/archaeal histone domain-containing protein n=1 Tax=Corymbia citriodora subsp. variegata TaxID=360336 RepID=A0A8T0CEW1_CORYI|nr:hypothetical protein BT93_L0094 [Corymbia citriodora subsp. variegata]
MAASPLESKDVEQPASGEDDNDMNARDDAAGGLGDFEVKEQDRWLPIANVARIMKTALPENAKIAKEAKECMQECVSEFISFITSEASEKCQQEKRKTVNGEDILFAMTSLGFENYGEALKIYLSKYREVKNPPRPTSSGSMVGGPVGGDQTGQQDSIAGLDANDNGPYGYPSGVTSGHNGIGTDTY